MEPIRDGYAHPAAKVLEHYFANDPRASDTVAGIVVADSETRAADTLRLLAQFMPATPAWRATIVATGLASPSVEVRDAAIHLVEVWEEPPLIGLLRRHREREPWLAAHIIELLPLLPG